MELAERDSKLVGWTVEIVATDFVEDALGKARKGIYSQFEVQRGLPVSLLVKYFHKVGNAWEIGPDIRGKVEFRTHNLLDDGQALGTFDVIFCRNVLIYFDEATKRAVLCRLASRLAADGYLVLGAAETTTGLSHDFMAVPEGQHGIFSFTPEAVASARAREDATRRKEGRGLPTRRRRPILQRPLRVSSRPHDRPIRAFSLTAKASMPGRARP
jgi:chemotaxis protein methyltransferase CheR